MQVAAAPRHAVSSAGVEPGDTSQAMFEIVKAGGIVMVPIILCSILAVAIALERLWTLREQRVVPAELTDKVWQWVENRALSDKQIMALQQHSPLGSVLAAGLATRHRDRAVMIEAIEDAGRHVVHDLERFLNMLGTIAKRLVECRFVAHAGSLPRNRFAHDYRVNVKFNVAVLEQNVEGHGKRQ